MKSNQIINAALPFTAVQPSFQLDTQEYRQLLNRTYAKDFIAMFYECTGVDLLLSSNSIDVVPDLSVDILFDLDGDPTDVKVLGYVERKQKSVINPGRHYFGVRLMPMGSAKIIGMPDKELKDEKIPLLDLIPNIEGDLLKIIEAEDIYRRADLFVNMFQPSSSGRMLSNRLAYMVDRIFETKGQLSIQDLSNEIGYSPRHLYTMFNEQFGMGVKSFCKIVRFQNALHYMLLTEDSGSMMAYDLGYYDQAHFIREFKSMADVTPSYWYKQMRKETLKNTII